METVRAAGRELATRIKAALRVCLGYRINPDEALSPPPHVRTIMQSPSFNKDGGIPNNLHSGTSARVTSVRHDSHKRQRVSGADGADLVAKYEKWFRNTRLL